jgi:hypothetical protein
VEKNRATMETLVRYLVEQDFIRRPIPLDDLFVPVN